MGFPEIPDDEAAFTDADIDALQVATRLFDRAGMDRTIALQQARAMSQAAARIASSQQDVIAGIVPDSYPAREAAEAVSLAEETLPALDHLLVYMYRRHLAAATEQSMLTATSEEGGVQMSVGFADLSRFTEMSQQLEVRQIAELVDLFNASTADVVTQVGGRVIKTIGDEVMFATADPRAAASIAITLLDTISRDGKLPPLKVGVATGTVIAREGDIFGPPVNLAHRLVSTAKSDSILVDEATREALVDDARFQLSPLARLHLKGLGHVRSFRLRTAEVGRPSRRG
jgi:adenylate cyclase